MLLKKSKPAVETNAEELASTLADSNEAVIVILHHAYHVDRTTEGEEPEEASTKAKEPSTENVARP